MWIALQMLWCWLMSHCTSGFPHRAPLLWRKTTTPSPCRQQTKPDWLKHEILRLKALMPNAGCRTIATIFNRRHACHVDSARRATVGKSYVADLVRRHHYEIKVMRRHIKHRVPAPMARNRVWALDLTAKTDAATRTHMILGLIDHGSRALMALQALPNKASWTLLGHLCLAIGRHGKPLAIRTDNEPVFKSRVFRSALACMGIRQQFTDPGCPWQNGRIERLFLTLKHKLDQIEVPGLHALNKVLGQFSFFYNFVRPHQHLQGRTPAEAWAGVDPWAAPVKREEWFQAWDGLLCGFHLRR
ncbi:integrase core domain-containing protein [Aquabacterium sp.]|uniref:integrase core domain-containing protein n=1 Tax=Aquabacterium sp. TaxID=1872578 RepID=UPI00248894F5|nr:integrase core domain-containing protein [Aquabacterium sp.]MDI1257913.1 integrase core domain-containing protein [Aquabacterium sp.]